MKKVLYPLWILVGVMIVFSSCSENDDDSYQAMLDDEQSAIDYFVDVNKIKAIQVSEQQLALFQNQASWENDSNEHFAAGQWYRFENNMYMNIHSFGDTTSLFSRGASVILRFEKANNLLLYRSGKTEGYDNLASDSYWLVSPYLPSLAGDYGEGVELPMKFVGPNALVSLIIPSKSGTLDDMAYVVPRYYGNMRYMLSYQ